jgi:hypothetical protein
MHDLEGLADDQEKNANPSKMAPARKKEPAK